MSPVNPIAPVLRLNAEFKSRWPRTVRPVLAPVVTGVLHLSKFSFPPASRAVFPIVAGLWTTGDGVRSLRRLFTYSDSNSNSSEGGDGGSSWSERAADNTCNAVISSFYRCMKDDSGVEYKLSCW